MARHTQAHMTRKIEKFRSTTAKEMEKQKMEYYMGAKLIEIGVDPKAAVYRWTMEEEGDREVWTCSAYWGDSKTQLLQEAQAR